MQNNNVLPDYTDDILKVLICAFPDGVPEEEYWPLLSILHTTMSFWVIADVLSVVAHKDRSEVYNDASGFGVDPLPPEEAVDKVRQKLIHCGNAK